MSVPHTGNRTSETISAPMSGFGWTTGTTGYDAEDRLINWNRADGNLNQAWDLSDVGNRDSLTTNSVTQNRSHSLAHELTAINTNPLTHDAKGNLTADDQGRLYTWDADNHLASVTKASITSSYAYDALGRRVTKTTGTATTVFVSLTQPIPPLGNLGGQIIAEYSAGAAASSPLRTYIFGEYVDEPLAVIDGSTTVIHYYHQNARFDVIALSSSTGGIVERCAYNAHGEPLIFDGAGATPRTASAFNNRFTFTGREFDHESGLYYFRARYFDARLGRFIGRDPIGYADGMSLYRGYFVPMNVDAGGLSSSEACCDGKPYNPTAQCCDTGILKDLFLVCIRGESSHAWLYAKNLNDGVSHSYGRWAQGYGDAIWSGVHTDIEQKAGRQCSVERCTQQCGFAPNINRGYNVFTNNCSSYAQEEWQAMTGEWLNTAAWYGGDHPDALCQSIRNANGGTRTNCTGSTCGSVGGPFSGGYPGSSSNSSLGYHCSSYAASSGSSGSASCGRSSGSCGLWW